MLGYHFTGSSLRDGRPIPPIGEWLEHEGEIVPCQSGLHSSECPFDALQYAPGNTLHRVELEGGLVPHGDPPDKWVGRRRKIVATIDAEELLRGFARWCALQVIDMWDAPPVVREYLETGDERKRDAARDAAREARAATRAAWAAWGAARATGAAAWAASRAAWGAAGEARAARASRAVLAAQREKFREMVEAAFAENRGGDGCVQTDTKSRKNDARFT